MPISESSLFVRTTFTFNFKKHLLCRMIGFTCVFFSACSVPSESNQPPTKHEIAEKVESTLRNAVCIRLETKVRQLSLGSDGKSNGGEISVRYEALMAKNAFKTAVFKDGKLIMAFSLVDSRIQEYRPLEESRPIMEYDTPYENGTPDCIVPAVENCLVGKATYSWVGVCAEPMKDRPESMDVARSMRTKIEQGVRQPDAIEHGRLCYIFKQEIPVEDGVIANIVYVDMKSFFVVRWDTFQPGFQRIRESNIEILPHIPQGTAWKINVQ